MRNTRSQFGAAPSHTTAYDIHEYSMPMLVVSDVIYYDSDHTQIIIAMKAQTDSKYVMHE